MPSTPVCEDALPWLGQEYCAAGDTVRAVEPVDGTRHLLTNVGKVRL